MFTFEYTAQEVVNTAWHFVTLREAYVWLPGEVAQEMSAAVKKTRAKGQDMSPQHLCNAAWRPATPAAKDKSPTCPGSRLPVGMPRGFSPSQGLAAMAWVFSSCAVPEDAASHISRKQIALGARHIWIQSLVNMDWSFFDIRIICSRLMGNVWGTEAIRPHEAKAHNLTDVAWSFAVFSMEFPGCLVGSLCEAAVVAAKG